MVYQKPLFCPLKKKRANNGRLFHRWDELWEYINNTKDYYKKDKR